MHGNFTEIINKCRKELSNINTRINSNKFDSFNEYLICYAIVKSSGTIEIIFKGIIYNYLINPSNVETQTYLEKIILNNSTNPKTSLIIKLLQNINTQWATDFGAQTKAVPNLNSDISSLVELRNGFAHGRNITTSIENVQKYFESAVSMLNILDSIVV